MLREILKLLSRDNLQVQALSECYQMIDMCDEMMRAAARLADEARELEKSEDTLVRTPHSSAGARLMKSRLGEKPS